MYQELIGQGRVSAIYREGDQAIKTFHESYPMSWITYEVAVQKEIVSHTQLPVIAYDYVEGSREIRMPLLDGIELTTRMFRDHYEKGLDDLMNLQLSIYQYRDLKLSNAHDDYPILLEKSWIDETYKKIARRAFMEIERNDCLCHFDFHFSNVMFVNNVYIIIDWVNAKLANPILDIARTYVILKQHISDLAKKYLWSMASSLKIDLMKFYPAIRVMAALRMLETETKELMEILIELITSERISDLDM